MKRFLLLIVGLAALLFWGCPATPNQNNIDYLRSPITFRIDTVPAAHPYCNTTQTSLTADSCKLVKKYALRWDRPSDTTGFKEYRIYLDTNPPNAPTKTWSQVSQDPTLASAIIPGAGGLSDSLIILFNNKGFHSASVTRGASQIIAFDTTGRVDSSGRFVFAIIAVNQDGSLSQPRYTWIITNDRFPPFPLQPLYTPLSRSVQIQWDRPLDPTSFFDPGADSGIIDHYVLKIVRSGILNGNRSSSFQPQVQYSNNGTDWSSRVKVTTFTGQKGAPGYRFVLPDSLHVFNSKAPDARDSLKAIITGLSPQDTVNIWLWAVDASGNLIANDTDQNAPTRIILTDTTEPLKPKLSLLKGSITHNQFIFSFAASRDLVQLGNTLVPVDSPNGNILQYHITRRRLSGSSGGAANSDSIVMINNRSDTLFIDTVRYLPPGATYRIYVQAIDSTGHLSQKDSVDVSTLPITFPVATSTCPSGFVPIPAASFLLGDSPGNVPDPDELPAVSHTIGSYCIENYEHIDNTTGRFQTHVTWKQAEEICQDISPSDHTHLCTEAEWERACEGPDSSALVYGFQSEDPVNNPNAITNTCDIGTGDSSMAVTPALRNPACLNREGVFDMAGNLAEWVLDPYSPGAYSSAPPNITPGQTLVPQVDSATHGFRGEYYLNSHLASTTVLHQSRCSNRDKPQQVRPMAYPGCLSSDQPLVAVAYNNAGAPRCLPIPASLQGKNIVQISPARDSTTILFLIDKVAQPVIDTLPYDSTYKAYRPISTTLTTKTMAALIFENPETNDAVPDTLDATEMTDTSSANLSLIFSREVSPPWRVRKVNGQYAIKFLYASSFLHNIDARRQYSNSAIGFRCCSLPRP